MAKQPLTNKSEAIRVVIRCRPMSNQEIMDGRECVVQMVKERGEVILKKPTDAVPKQFTFDSVYDWNSEQENIFAETAYPICNNVIQGYNGTIFAYGQTGTGKTFTISGVPKDPKLKGIMPRAFDNVFMLISGDTEKQFLVRVSYLEIYNEEIRDLMNKKNPGQKLELKDKDTGVYVKDLTTYVVKTPQDMLKVFEEGSMMRHVGQTAMNEQSSRSHAVFTITVESSILDAEGTAHIKVGKLNIVDLAGSERQSKTGATGDRLKEATKINLSLSTLCHVISSLTDSKCTYIPYRDSKLTRILQDSLGGNTKTVMITNMGPADYNIEESLSTLRYASRAKQIQNKPRINEDPKEAMIREFHDEITRLRDQLSQMMGNTTGGPAQGMSNNQSVGGLNAAPGEDRFIPVENKEKMKQMEDGLEAEKKAMMKDFEKQKALIGAKADIVEEEKTRLLEELKTKNEAEQKEKLKQQKLLKKLKNMEEKIVQGNAVLEKAMRQEQKLLKAAAQLEDRRRQQAQLQADIVAQEHVKIQLKQNYSNKQEELESKNGQIDQVWRRYQQTKGELDDISEVIHREREDLMDRIRDLTREIRLKHLIIDQFVPTQEYMRVERRSEWAEEINDWVIPNLEYTGNNIKLQKAQMKEAQAAGQFAVNFHENLILDEASEDEDYEAAATKRVNEAITSILQEEEEEMGVQPQGNFVPPEKQSVYFRYTDEGAVREDPEEAAKREQQKKKRLQSAKRPLTAKKKKADMVTGDIEKMVTVMGAQQRAEMTTKMKRAKMYPQAKGLVKE